MFKKSLLAALIMTLGLNLGSANAFNCTCWSGIQADSKCYGRVDPFGGDLIACNNACQHYTKRPAYGIFGFVDEPSLKQCQDQGNAKVLGPW